ncbi:unnamed protein product [Prorocentrum cordatum]|uniref:Uncharacterized protein n=1 Tax=Prorocentrum cordatum TaxID=2364126 RepID=A0ABN9UQL3_9DINO|nr:unnamed protein product [Polarella glacialis]
MPASQREDVMRAARLSRFENQGGSSAAEGGREPASQPPVAGLSSAGSGRAASSAGPPAGPAPEVMGHVQTATFGAAPEGPPARPVDPAPAHRARRTPWRVSCARAGASCARLARERKKIRQRVSQSSWASASPTPGRRWRSAAGTGSSPPTGCWCGARMPPRPSGWPPPRLACGLPSTRPQRRHAQLASTGRSARPRSLSARPGWHITAPLGSATLSALP